MAKRISESDLIVPALYCIASTEDGILTTSDLSECLRTILRPTGEDLEILAGRSDDKFSQIVRNLRSHGTLEKLGVCTYHEGSPSGFWQITEKGHDLLEAQREFLEYLIGNGFYYEETKLALEKLGKEIATPREKKAKAPLLFDETIVVREGEAQITRQKTYKRSAKLREAAIQHYAQNNRIVCHACGFDFEEVYGEHGRGFIEIHHLKPVYTYDEADTERVIREALANVIPLCSNCHKIVHRSKPMHTVDELKAIIKRRFT